jgi:hypothetical protein
MDDDHFQIARQVFCNLKDEEVKLATRHSLPGSDVTGVSAMWIAELAVLITSARG